MGNKTTSSKDKDDMPKKLKEKVLKLFRLIDVDDSKTIDFSETLKFWGNNFAKINAQELFQSVDKDNNGSIEESEWIEFWYNVYKSGHSVDDICCELDTIIEGGSWVKFEDVQNLNKEKNKKKGKY